MTQALVLYLAKIMKVMRFDSCCLGFSWNFFMRCLETAGLLSAIVLTGKCLSGV